VIARCVAMKANASGPVTIRVHPALSMPLKRIDFPNRIGAYVQPREAREDGSVLDDPGVDEGIVNVHNLPGRTGY
jgi:hypothetical protein